MNTIQSNYHLTNFEYQFRDLTKEQRQGWYNSLYCEDGSVKPIRVEDFIVQDIPGWDGSKPSQMQGYAIERVGDDYVIFAMNPSIYFGGEKELTPDQLEYLRNKYNMESLSKDDRIKLLAELSCFGVISGSDAYAEAFPEKCSWMKDKHQQFGIGSMEIDLEKWIEYYLQRVAQAKDDMNKIILNARTGIAYFEAERRTYDFYSKLAKVVSRIAQQ